MLFCDLVKREIDKEMGWPKGSRNKSSASVRVMPHVSHLRVRSIGDGSMQITKTIEKKVTHPISGLPVVRKANVTFNVPDYTVKTILTGEKDKDGNILKDAKGNPRTKDVYQGLGEPNALQNALNVFGNTERLIAYAISGLENQIRVDQSNALAKSDKATRVISSMAKSMKKVMGDLATDDMIRAMLMSNPATKEAFGAQAEDLSTEINVEVSANDYEPRVVRPDTASDENEESDGADEKDAA